LHGSSPKQTLEHCRYDTAVLGSCAHRLEGCAVVEPDGAIGTAHHYMTIAVTAAAADCDACELRVPGVGMSTLSVPEVQGATLLQTWQAAERGGDACDRVMSSIWG
jgi:hypothetical protein